MAGKEPAEAEQRIDYRSLDLEQDLAALVELLGEVERADPTGDSITEDALREQLTWTGQDPAPNNWVATVTNGSLLVGYGLIQKTPNDPNADVYVAVHPAWRRRGIGTQLFTYLLARASAPDGSIAGTGRAELREPATQGDVPTALVDAPGLVSRYRHADLGPPLLLAAIHWLLPKGPAAIDLEAWGEAPATLARYRELGFAVTKEEISYRRRLQ